jgi:hypothetical protein
MSSSAAFIPSKLLQRPKDAEGFFAWLKVVSEIQQSLEVPCQSSQG